MKITRFSKYEQGKPSGKLDTQLFPECSGTDQDRDIVKKTVKRKQTQKTAARPKTMVGLEAINGGGPRARIDKVEYDKAYSSAVHKYKTQKDTGLSDPRSLFWEDEKLIESIKQALLGEGFSELTAEMASMTVVYADTTRERQRPPAQLSTQTAPTPEAAPVPAPAPTTASAGQPVKTAETQEERFKRIEQEINSIFSVPDSAKKGVKVEAPNNAQYSSQRAEKRKETFNMKAASLKKPSCDDCTLDGIKK